MTTVGDCPSEPWSILASREHGSTKRSAHTHHEVNWNHSRTIRSSCKQQKESSSAQTLAYVSVARHVCQSRARCTDTVGTVSYFMTIQTHQPVCRANRLPTCRYEWADNCSERIDSEFVSARRNSTRDARISGIPRQSQAST